MLDKKVGETPLIALTSWKQANPAYEGVPASYAGRLDPMASGKLLIVLGEECKRQASYTGLDKEYELEVLLDVGSDTGDALGIVQVSNQETRVDSVMLEKVLVRERGAHERAYPVYSSKTVNGKPLFLHALEGNLSDIEIPVHTERIFRTRLLEVSMLSVQELETRIKLYLALAPVSDEPSKVLGADFRIADVRASWDDIFLNSTRSFALVRLRVVAGSGTYMRSLAGRIGAALGTKALAVSIHRTKIGKYWKGCWVRQF